MPKKLILIVEDDESVRKLLDRALSTLYQVESYPDGSTALRRLEADPCPDLMICDIMMPGIDGLTLARKVKAAPKTRSVPIVFLTAKTTPKDVIQGIQVGARQYITKPFKLNELLDKVKKILPP